MNDFIETQTGIFIQKKDIQRVEHAADDKTLWICTTNHGRYFVKKTKLPMKVTK